MNAGQALRASTSRERRIDLRTRTDSEGWAVIEIADTGPGIAKEVRNTLFDPFVTTKPAGTGTGLGLPVSRAIVEELGGVLSVESPPEKALPSASVFHPIRLSGSCRGARPRTFPRALGARRSP